LYIDEVVSITKLFFYLPGLGFLTSIVVELPSPIGLRFWWNFGSMLGILIVVQLLTGWLLTFYYVNRIELRFTRVWLLHIESWNGRLLHWIHINGASFIFFIVYLHALKGIHFQSWKTNKAVWLTGFIILVFLMGAAFLGYVLPFGQISLWGATVITNLLRVISVKLVIWIWGGYRVNSLTLNLFFTLHYLLPIVIMMIMFSHLWCLHYNGRTHMRVKRQFWPLYVWKDGLNVVLIVWLLWWTLIYTYMTADVENFIFANPAISPLHIKPEWYFLTYYAILRRIPNKLLGVIIFALRLFILALLVFNNSLFLNFYSPCWGGWTRLFVILNIILIMIGGAPVETPYLEVGQLFTVWYFLWFVFLLVFN
jgi:quinol-cytochrome oxidoreductase complex cytochrome b subunit